ncbi:hypothetical protein [Bacillus sp. FJAT-22090]|uniref:hypothetical protein n=1 Tax=Bacillus sp. FJAT-22090 TaxID=1581038 RepID=UPI0011A7EAD0|nr:hypothetical protein [Bacillus sp. FJAT-22090]
MVIKKGSMREVIKSVNDILINDEELLRSLWYLPEDVTGTDPMSSTLLDVKSLANYWDIVNQRIMLAEKVDDLEADPLCRLYISSGRRRPVFNNYLLATQEIVINVFVHEDYELDGRTEWIGDRLNELLALERLDGSIGMFEYAGGNPRVAPIGYKRYEHTFSYSTGKK